jgi:hypothetical protein
LYNAKQQCIKLNIFADEVLYNINLSISGQAMATVLPLQEALKIIKNNITHCFSFDIFELKKSK